MALSFTTRSTPDGPFTVVASPSALVAAGWTADVAVLVRAVSPVLIPADGIGPGDAAPIIDQALGAIAAYYDGDFAAVAAVPVAQVSGPFRQRAWEALRRIPAGQAVSYAGLAALAGVPGAARAAGAACSHNAVALFVPCHRVVTASGLTGSFAYGAALKRRLLAREGWSSRPPNPNQPALGEIGPG